MSTIGRTTLDLFLLAMISDGNFVTPYDLLRQLRMSPGASIPALKRLQEKGYVKKARAGPRRRQAFRITTKGDNWIEAQVDNYLRRAAEKAQLDPESVGRAVALALSEYPSNSYGRRILAATFKRCRRGINESLEELDFVKRRKASGTTQDIYRWVRLTIEIAQWKAEAAAIRQIHSEIRSREINNN